MTFNTTGPASTASVDDQWTIRSNAYEWRVAPVNDHAEMLMGPRAVETTAAP
jgi:hypothetical protein